MVEKDFLGQQAYDGEDYRHDARSSGGNASAELDCPTDEEPQTERHVADGKVSGIDDSDVDARSDYRGDEAKNEAEDIVAGSDRGGRRSEHLLGRLRSVSTLTILLLLAGKRLLARRCAVGRLRCR